MRGRVWATDAGHVVRVEARLDSAVSVGWGLIARIWQELAARQSAAA